MSKRIWELDVLRGICILGMVIVHFIYDLGSFGFKTSSRLFLFVQYWGGTVFVLISGICVTLGSRHIRRGLAVFGCGMLCTAVTAGMYWLGLDGKGIIIYFGVLHCLGTCMLLWGVLRRCPNWLLAVLGSSFCAAGLYLERIILVDSPWLIPLGFLYPGFSSSDYFPLLPNLGYFLFGALLGRTLYRRKETLFPKLHPNGPSLRFLCQCGRQSLLIYLLHQPLIAGVLALFTVRSDI